MGNLTNSWATTPVNEQDATKVVTYNAALQILDSAINGRLPISTTGGTTTLTGTPAAPQSQNLFLDVSGTLTSNAIIEIPIATGTGRNRVYVVRNATSGAFTVTVRKVGGTGVTVTQGNTAFLLYNGSDIQYAGAQVNSSTGAQGFEGALTAYTPTVTSGSGTITTLGTVTGRWKQVGKIVFFEFDVNITTNGTAAGWLNVSLPATPAAFKFSASGLEGAVTGKGLRLQINASSSTGILTFYDNTYPGGDGREMIVTGWYEVP